MNKFSKGQLRHKLKSLAKNEVEQWLKEHKDQLEDLPQNVKHRIHKFLGKHGDNNEAELNDLNSALEPDPNEEETTDQPQEVSN